MGTNIRQTHKGTIVCWPDHITTTGKPERRLFTDEWILERGFNSDKTVPCSFLMKRNGTA
ncbi:hypothetical protein Pan153_09040 [Gimesia panareensis]|uniref:Uncharacterized protein n=1 Tax=Gimesia panareensis TaxID=2527978 RepID=A0A518A6V8_9PLAN|nr:hypothetical protein Enr10x_19830 [Gimesia panareensis]QDU50425.1 hypothetical protein Pan110_27710 [Gimesia panareensis]QDV16277.1 hypothetical protein Pan153_09040 [Gimesia panareensis]